MDKNKLRSVAAAFLLCCMPNFMLGLDIVGADTEILIDDKEAGTLYKGTHIQKDGSKYKVSASVMSGNEYILFYNDMDRIKLARITGESVKNLKIISEKEDEYGVKWKNIELSFNTKDPSVIKNTKDGLWEAEEDLYLRCGSCHVAKAIDEYTINQWPNVVKTMSDRAGLNKDETRLVGSYLQYKLLDKSNK
ncbi:hypothetical protein [Campylobacter sp. 7477a]|uniref:hypothetical protein n=1 Tax=Campylobacter sp. 7477a TaxID=2735741 RepID=UPI003014663A|nr:hypothetical protein [Campylobacter sp. 7477a]